MQDSGSLAVFKVTARDQGHYKGPSGAFVTYCNISCLFIFIVLFCFYVFARYFKSNIIVKNLRMFIFCTFFVKSSKYPGS